MFLAFKLERKLIKLAIKLLGGFAALRPVLRRIEVKFSNQSFLIKNEVDLYFKVNLPTRDYHVYRKLKSLSQSQCRQDLIIGLINNWNPGVIIEVGAADGLLLSNSFLLEKYLGWHSILVEPCRSWQDSLKLNRTSSKLIFDAAFHTPNLSLPFTETEFAELSGLSGALPKDYWSLERENSFQYSVNTTTLDLICDNFDCEGKFLTLTIDIEGGELDALRGFTRRVTSAGLLVIENNGNLDLIFSLDEILFNRGFVRLDWPFKSFDSWYLRQDLLENRVVLRRLIHDGVLNIKDPTSI